MASSHVINGIMYPFRLMQDPLICVYSEIITGWMYIIAYLTIIFA